ncbi:hypothetical protein EON83_20090 [bacterium]|nr:MAG: hypothetical protein EON83_20090 [bacterium]
MPVPLQLTLTSHELFSLPPNTPATGSALRVEVARRGKKTFPALARTVPVNTESGTNYSVFIRDEQRAQDEIFRGGHFFIRTEQQPLSEDQLIQKITQAIKSEDYTRFCKLPQSPYCLGLNSKGLGNIIREKGQPNWGLDFVWGTEDEHALMLDWNMPEFQSFCEHLITAPNSELNFFLDWQKHTEAERFAFATRCEQGNWEQTVSLFTSVLQLMTHYYGPYPGVGEKDSYWMFTSGWYVNESPATPFARRWRTALCEIIRPAFWPQEQLCCSKWRHRESHIKSDVECAPPTAHEVLEAQLHLREFLHPHLSESEIEALLTP